MSRASGGIGSQLTVHLACVGCVGSRTIQAHQRFFTVPSDVFLL